MASKPISGGPEGETIFHRQFFCLLPNELPLLFQQVEGLHDHRLLALVTAWIVEDRVDKLLASFCPRYEQLSEQNEFTFSLKIRMLEALSFIPRSITDACHLIRTIRNDFAHNLERTCFSDVDKKIVRRMEALLRRVRPDWRNPSFSNEVLSSNYRNLSIVAIIGVDGYYTNVLKLREKISESEFVSALASDVKQELDRKFKESKDRGAKFARRNEKKWEVHYDSFADIVDELPPGVPVIEEEVFAQMLRQEGLKPTTKPKPSASSQPPKNKNGSSQ